MRALRIKRPRGSNRYGDTAEFFAHDGLRIAFGVIWAIDAVFKWTPAFRHELVGILNDAAQGQPSWLHGWFHLSTSQAQAHPGLFVYSTAVIETTIALALLLGFARKTTYIAGALFSLLIWATAEGFGGPYSSGSTDIGAAVMYAVVFAGLLALSYESGPSYFCVDHLVERRVSWWYRIAEVGSRWREPTPATASSVAGAPTTSRIDELPPRPQSSVLHQQTNPEQTGVDQVSAN